MDDSFDDNLDELEDMEETCAVHEKELDMVCLEPNCETPVCSKCILIGEHKNHKYIEKEKFFKGLEIEKRKINSFFLEINNSEQKLKKNNNNNIIKNIMQEKKNKLKEELEYHHEKLIKALEKRKDEVSREINIYFDQQEEKLQNYVTECIESTNQNKTWKNKLDESLKNLTNSGEDIESGFLFKKKCEEFKFEDNSQQIIKNIIELQKLINTKKDQCINSFNIEYQTIDPTIFTIKKEDVSFKQDLRERMKIFTNQETESKNEKEMEFDGGIDNAINQYRKSGAKESDLFNDNLDLDNLQNNNITDFKNNLPPNQYMKQSMTQNNILSNNSGFNMTKQNDFMRGSKYMTMNPHETSFYSQTNNNMHGDIHTSIKRNSQNSTIGFNNNPPHNMCKFIF